MSKEDIDRAVRDAEKYAEEDKKLKEAVEVKNRADSMIFQIEKALEDFGDKVDANDKAEVNAAIEKLKATLKTDDTEAIKADTEALEKTFYKLSEKMYQASGAGNTGYNGGESGGEDEGGADGGNGYYDADFEDKTNG